MTVLETRADETTDTFTAEGLAVLAADAGLSFPAETLGAIVAAIRAEKHVVLTGPPGTGKTSLAKLVAELGRRALLCSGYLTATATSAWTVSDTVGSGSEAFRPGVIVEAIESGRWLLIDELNRADVDRAFGEFFSVLSGHDVVLPYRRTSFSDRISIVPFGAETPAATEPIKVPRPWRIVATMNNTDRGQLFQLSRALLRRFAFVHVVAPPDEVIRDLVRGPGDIVAGLLPFRQLQPLGPAIFVDAAHYAAIRLRDGVPGSQVLLEAFGAYVLPQLDDLSGERLGQALAVLDQVLSGTERAAARRLLADLGSAA